MATTIGRHIEKCLDSIAHNKGLPGHPEISRVLKVYTAPAKETNSSGEVRVQGILGNEDNGKVIDLNLAELFNDDIRHILLDDFRNTWFRLNNLSGQLEGISDIYISKEYGFRINTVSSFEDSEFRPRTLAKYINTY